MKRKNYFLLFMVVLVYFFIFAPLILIALTSFTTESYIGFPPVGFSLKWYENVFSNQTFIDAFKLSFLISTAATVIALLVGIPGAYALSRYNFKGKKLIKDLFFSPNMVPQVVCGFALFTFIIVRLRLSVRVALLVGLAISVVTYAFRIVGASIESLDYAIEEAGMSLGASRLTVFFKIVLPNISSGIVSAFLLAFINAFNTVPLTIFLSGPGVTTLPVAMMSYIEYNYDPTVSALSVLLMIMSFAIMLVTEKLVKVGK